MTKLIFHAYDDNDYEAQIIGVKNEITAIEYQVRGKRGPETVTAYLDKPAAASRLTVESDQIKLPPVAALTFTATSPAPLPPFTLDGGSALIECRQQGRLF